MSNKIINILIYTLLAIGVLASGNLVLNEMVSEGTCPKLGFIPACYLVFLWFLVPLIVHFLKRYNMVFYLFISFAFILATYASIGQFLEKITCPKTDFGLPKCYISFGLLLLIIVLKYTYSKNSSV